MNIQSIIKVHPEKPEQAIISRAAQTLNNGGLVVAPTETRYGLLAKIDNRVAVEKLFEIKGRSIDKPSAIFVEDISRLKQFADVSAIAQILAESFLPGPLTLVLKSNSYFGPYFTKNQMTGFRISSSPVIAAIVAITGPISATSANLSGQIEPNDISGIYDQLGGRVELYLDAGTLNNPSSTVVQVINDDIKILREGAINSQAIMKAIGL